MKKLLLIIALCAKVALASAQTQTETLEWLNTKKADFQYNYSSPAYFDGVTLGRKMDEGWRYIAWSDIKSIQAEREAIKIISKKEDQEAKNITVYFFVSKELSPKVLKALKHMATLNGAKLVNDDLF